MHLSLHGGGRCARLMPTESFEAPEPGKGDLAIFESSRTTRRPHLLHPEMSPNRKSIFERGRRCGWRARHPTRPRVDLIRGRVDPTRPASSRDVARILMTRPQGPRRRSSAETCRLASAEARRASGTSRLRRDLRGSRCETIRGAPRTFLGRVGATQADSAEGRVRTGSTQLGPPRLFGRAPSFLATTGVCRVVSRESDPSSETTEACAG
jgi:hypothetical protein